MFSIHFNLFSFSLCPVRGKSYCPCSYNCDSDFSPLAPVLRGRPPDGANSVVVHVRWQELEQYIQFCGRNYHQLRFLMGSFYPVSQHYFACVCVWLRTQLLWSQSNGHSVRLRQIYGLQGVEHNNQWDTISKIIWGTYINFKKRYLRKNAEFSVLKWGWTHSRNNKMWFLSGSTSTVWQKVLVVPFNSLSSSLLQANISHQPVSLLSSWLPRPRGISSPRYIWLEVYLGAKGSGWHKTPAARRWVLNCPW